MPDITSSHAKQHFGEVLELARREPVTVSKSGRTAVAILDIAEYHRLRRIENDYWVNLANEAKAGGMIGTDEAASQVTALLGDGEGA